MLLKVSKFQNEFMKSSFVPKYDPNIVRIFAQYVLYRSEILKKIYPYFGRNDDFKNSVQGRNPYNIWFIFWEKR